MTRRTATIDPDYFESMYRSDADPWGFRTSGYEQGKYAATLAALSRLRYRSALEIGCSIGVFTADLAQRCDAVLAIDGSQSALDAARHHCAASPHVRFERRMVPAAFPDGSFDLIVLSEVLYYLVPFDLRGVAERCAETLASDGEIVLCHWLGETDYPLTGQQASDLFADAISHRLPVRTVLHDETYRLDRFQSDRA